MAAQPLSMDFVNEAVAGLRQRRNRGLDVAAPDRPAPLPVIQAGPGSGLGEALGQLGAAAVGRMAQKSAPAAPTFSSAAESARANTPGFVGGQGAMTAPGTQFMGPPKIGIDGPPKGQDGQHFFRRPQVQMFAQGGTLRKPGEVAVVGEDEPELLVRGEGGAAHVIPMSAIQGSLDALKEYGANGGAPSPQTPQSPPAPVPPPEVKNGIPLSVLDALKPKPAGGVTPSGAAPSGEMRPRTVGGGVPLSALDGLKPAEQTGATQPGNGGLPLSVLDGLKGMIGQQSRARVVDRPAHLDRSAAYDEDPRNAEEDRDGSRLKSGAKSAALLGLDALAKTGSPVSAATAAAGGFALGAARPGTDERILQQQRAAQNRQRAEAEREREGERLKLEGQRADIRYRDAQTEYTQTTRKDEAARRKLEAESRDVDRRKRQLLAQLRAMPTVDSGKHAEFLSAWEREFGEPFDVKGYNDKKSNFVVRGLITDPSKPQEKHDVAINFVTGETRDLGPSGYVAPRDAEGLTASERATITDRRKLLDRRARNMDLIAEVLERDLRGMTAGEKRALDASLVGLPAELGRLRGELKKWKEGRYSLTTDVDKADEEIARLEDAINDVSTRIEEARGRAGVPGAGAGRPGRFTGQRLSRSKLPQAAKRWGLGDGPDALKRAEELFISEGGEVY